MTSNNPNTFPDGFPKEIIAAIQASTFLSENEKQEWLDWYPTSTEDEQLDVVETLHGLWVQSLAESTESELSQNPTDTQVNSSDQVNFGNNDYFNPTFSDFNPVVSSPFSPEKPAAPAAKTAFEAELAPGNVQFQPQVQFSPNPKFGNDIVEETVPTESFSVIQNPTTDIAKSDLASFDSEFKNELKTQEANKVEANSLPETVKRDEPKPEVKINFNEPKKADETAEKNQENSEVTFNKDLVEPVIITPKLPSEEKPKLSNSESSAEKPKTESLFKAKTEPTETKKPEPVISKPETVAQNTPSKSESVAETFAKPTPTMNPRNNSGIEELYKHFLDTQSQTVEFEREYKDKQAKLFDKIMAIVGQATELSDKILETDNKIMKVNDKVVEQAKVLQETSNAVQLRPGGVSVQSQINSLKDDLKKIERNLSYDLEKISNDLADFRSDISSKYNELSVQVAAALADTYLENGIQNKIDKLVARIEVLEVRKGGETTIESRDNQQGGNQNNFSSKLKNLENRRPDSNNQNNNQNRGSSNKGQKNN